MGRKKEQQLQAEVEAHRASLATKAAEVASLTSTIGALKEQHKAATDTSMKEKVQLATMLKKAQHAAKVAVRDSSGAVGKVSALEAGLAAARAELNATRGEQGNQDSALADARRALADAREAQAALKSQVDALRAKTLMQQAGASVKKEKPSSSRSSARASSAASQKSTRRKAAPRREPKAEAAPPSVDMSSRLVDEAAKSMKLGLEVQAYRSEKDALMAEIVNARTVLLQRMLDGSDVNIDKYRNVKFTDLVRIWIDNSSGSSGGGGGGRSRGDSATGSSTFVTAPDSPSSSRSGGYGGGASVQKQVAQAQEGGASAVVIHTNRSEVQTYKRRCLRLQAQVDELGDRLVTADALELKVGKLRERSNEYASRLSLEKDRHATTKNELMNSNERLVMLSEHVEKLMVHLKHEAAAKVKAESVVKRFERDAALLRQKSGVLRKRTIVQKRALLEMREGSKILEDQLRLMDEKYIELRSKLDWTRSHAKREVRVVDARFLFRICPPHLPPRPQRAREHARARCLSLSLFLSLSLSLPLNAHQSSHLSSRSSSLRLPLPPRLNASRRKLMACEASGRWQGDSTSRSCPKNSATRTASRWTKCATSQRCRRRVRSAAMGPLQGRSETIRARSN